MVELRNKCSTGEQQVVAGKELVQSMSAQIESLKKQLDEANAMIKECNVVIANNKDVSDISSIPSFATLGW